MEYLHTMVRISDIEQSLHFFCEVLGMVEIRRHENTQGRFTLIFLAAPKDEARAHEHQAPLLELTYNWPNESGTPTEYSQGRHFGHLAYRVDNIYETCQHLLDKGITLHRPPRDGVMAFIKSPDGISIELLQKGAPLPKQAPWDTMDNIGSW